MTPWAVTWNATNAPINAEQSTQPTPQRGIFRVFALNATGHRLQ